jgi:hypothetical protein
MIVVEVKKNEGKIQGGKDESKPCKGGGRKTGKQERKTHGIDREVEVAV